MSLRPSVRKKEDDNADDIAKPHAWTQEHVNALHEMVEEYLWMRKARKKAKWAILCILGAPAALLAFWEPLDRLLKLIGWKIK